MKRVFISLLIFMSSLAVNGQVASVGKSIFNIQTGFLGIWINNELRLSDKFTLRTEAGLDGGFFLEAFMITLDYS